MPRRSSARSHSITSQESYGTVMITDLAADVPVNTVVEEEDQTPTKEATNLAYDTHMDGEFTSPISNDHLQKSNGAGISKGVILNAVQFGLNECKIKGEEKSIPMTTTLQVPEIKQPVKEPNGFKDMSLGRKFAFGFSFLPSILFVLCFSVILPCKPPKPCIHEVWRVELNNTEFTTGLVVPDSIVFRAIKEGQNALLQLDKTDGKLKEVQLVDNSTYLKCGKITNKDVLDCLVMDRNGELHLFNSSLDEMPTNITIELDEKFSPPAILPSCDGDIEDIAVAINNTKIIMNNGKVVTDYSCDSIPTKMTAWTINGSSNVIFICEKDGEDKLIRIPKNIWCGDKNLTAEKTVILRSGPLDSLKESIFEPIKDGMVLWSKNEVLMIQSNNTVAWSTPTQSHHNKNRFVLFGKFLDEGEQLALISSNLSSGLQVTLLDPVDGKLIKNFSHLYYEATQVIRVEGKKKDSALLLLKKMDQDSVTTAINKIKDTFTIIVNMISNENVTVESQAAFSEELALMEFDAGDMGIDRVDMGIDIVQTLKKSVIDGAYKSAMTAIHDEKSGVLSIYFVNTEEKLTEVKNIDVANWDKSVKSKCK